MNEEFIARIAANPAGERGMKQFNRQNNKGKNTVLKAEAKKQGRSRGKGKRAAEAEPDAESQDTPAEAQDAASAPQAAA